VGIFPTLADVRFEQWLFIAVVTAAVFAFWLDARRHDARDDVEELAKLPDPWGN
jgi:hypothetical protein